MDEVGEIILRPMSSADVADVARLNKLAYPTLAEDNVVWSEEHLRAHLRVFPEGQILALIDDVVVGAVSTLVVSLGSDPYRDHTWLGITDSGWFTNHDPSGDTLYGADVYVHPDYRGRGIGAALYEARRALARRLNLRRIVLGGRLWGYSRRARQMTPEEYARRVERGELRDLVISFQLREGFQLRKVMPNYLNDRRSRDHAGFLEWINPDFKPAPREGRRVRVTCVQYQMRALQDFEGFAQQVEFFVDVAADYGSRFALFPEFLTTQLISLLDERTPRQAILKLTAFTEQVDELFAGLSQRYQLGIVGGSHPRTVGDVLHNVATLYLPDGRMYRQPKLHITPNERRWWGIEGGHSLQVIETPWAKVAMLVCYDIEFPELARWLVDQGVQILFVPFCTDDRQAYLRVRYCAQARCVENVVYVAMAGTVGNLPAVPNMDVQYAQSAVLSPSDFAFARDGVIGEATPNTEMVVTCDLDLDALARAVQSGSVTPRIDRRLDLFRLEAVGLK